MIKKIVSFLGFFLLITITAWAFGIRVHTENLSEYMNKPKLQKLYQFTLINGQSLDGAILEETEDSFKISLGDATIGLLKSEIAETNELSSADTSLLNFKNLLEKHEKKPLVSLRKEDTLLGKMNGGLQYLIDEQERIGAQIEKNSPRKKMLRAAQEAAQLKAQAKLDAYRASQFSE